MSNEDRIDPATLSDQASIYLSDPNKGYRFTQPCDWIIMLASLDHTAFRVYATLLAIATKQSNFRKRLTKDEVRFVMAGVNEKPMARRTLNEALKRLEENELLVMSGQQSKQVRGADGKWKQDDSFHFELKVWPSDPDSFTGYRSVMEKLDDYPGPGWDTGVIHNRPGRMQNSADGPDQGDQGDTPSSREQNSADGRREQNSAGGKQNSADPEPLTSDDDAPYSSSHTAVSQEGASVRPSGSGDAHETDGQTDGDPVEKKLDDLTESVLRDPLVFDLAQRLGVRPSQGDKIRSAVRGLIEMTEDAHRVRGYLLSKLREARTVTYVIDGLTTYAADVWEADRVRSPEQRERDLEQHNQRLREQERRNGVEAEPRSRAQSRETPEDLLKSLGSSGAFLPTRLRA